MSRRTRRGSRASGTTTWYIRGAVRTREALSGRLTDFAGKSSKIPYMLPLCRACAVLSLLQTSSQAVLTAGAVHPPSLSLLPLPTALRVADSVRPSAQAPAKGWPRPLPVLAFPGSPVSTLCARGQGRGRGARRRPPWRQQPRRGASASPPAHCLCICGAVEDGGHCLPRKPTENRRKCGRSVIWQASARQCAC